MTLTPRGCSVTFVSFDIAAAVLVAMAAFFALLRLGQQLSHKSPSLLRPRLTHLHTLKSGLMRGGTVLRCISLPFSRRDPASGTDSSRSEGSRGGGAGGGFIGGTLLPGPLGWAEAARKSQWCSHLVLAPYLVAHAWKVVMSPFGFWGSRPTKGQGGNKRVRVG